MNAVSTIRGLQVMEPGLKNILPQKMCRMWLFVQIVLQAMALLYKDGQQKLKNPQESSPRALDARTMNLSPIHPRPKSSAFCNPTRSVQGRGTQLRAQRRIANENGTCSICGLEE